MTPRRAVLAGTLVLGVIDLTDALVFWSLRGAPPKRVLQGIASGLLGREAALQGGTKTAVLGLALHFFIAFMVVLVYMLASRRAPVLARRPFLFGPAYGLCVYLVMFHVVLPLSAGKFVPGTRALLVNQLLVHAFGVGLSAALAAWMARPARPSSVSPVGDRRVAASR